MTPMCGRMDTTATTTKVCSNGPWPSRPLSMEFPDRKVAIAPKLSRCRLSHALGRLRRSRRLDRLANRHTTAEIQTMRRIQRTKVVYTSCRCPATSAPRCQNSLAAGSRVSSVLSGPNSSRLFATRPVAQPSAIIMSPYRSAGRSRRKTRTGTRL